MWCSDRRGLLLLLLAAGGCGFRPLYGTGSEAAAILPRIALGDIRRDEVPDRMTWTFRDALDRRLGGGAEAFRLAVTLAVEERGLAITQGNETTRYNLTGFARWTLTASGAAEPALSGTEESFTAYSATATPYATRVARRDAERRLALDLAERVVTAIAARAPALPA